jgi:hypothetical protein
LISNHEQGFAAKDAGQKMVLTRDAPPEFIRRIEGGIDGAREFLFGTFEES